MNESTKRILAILNTEQEKVTIERQDLQLVVNSLVDLAKNLRKLHKMILEMEQEFVYPHISGFGCSICDIVDLEVDSREKLEHDEDCYIGLLSNIVRDLSVK